MFNLSREMLIVLLFFLLPGVHSEPQWTLEDDIHLKTVLESGQDMVDIIRELHITPTEMYKHINEILEACGESAHDGEAVHEFCTHPYPNQPGGGPMVIHELLEQFTRLMDNYHTFPFAEMVQVAKRRALERFFEEIEYKRLMHRIRTKDYADDPEMEMFFQAYMV